MDGPDRTIPTAPSRRDFVRAVGAAAIGPALGADGSPGAETRVARLFRSLTDRQKAELVFPHDHPLRQVARADWKVVEPSVGDLTDPQRELCRRIFRDLFTEDGFDRISRVMDDDGGGFGRYHVALFGDPAGDRPFEWLLTGPHLTIRASGRRDGEASSGGPWYFGHSARDRNAWADHARLAREVYDALGEGQKAAALVTRGEREADRLRSLRGGSPVESGVAIADLDDRGRARVRTLLSALISPFRAVDAPAVSACLDPASTACEALRLTFFEGYTPAREGLDPIWKLEGPAFSWHYHGLPHAHSWLRFLPAAEGR